MDLKCVGPIFVALSSGWAAAFYKKLIETLPTSLGESTTENGFVDLEVPIPIQNITLSSSNELASLYVHKNRQNSNLSFSSRAFTDGPPKSSSNQNPVLAIHLRTY
ncbi:hypothetical protein CAPTEDRAFT_210833 [Capitella teleta]|uniref:Uncharacterized protein n=1 Tax=Capitella teleta TaxID=283909 RepID=R7U0X4_CAPTE|nr:hypothetical protein CAPTEDRAFT_210833 [Capitella teleta]|eukprot:ELT99848.1 hypothetical protein CAPTEDRAFT_210833 [Capitella teleta]